MNPDVLTNFDETPLHRVVMNEMHEEYDYSDMIKLLINFGADCNFSIKPKDLKISATVEATPFMYAVKFGKIEYADIMLKNGNANINAATSLGKTAAIFALEMALHKNNIEIDQIKNEFNKSFDDDINTLAMKRVFYIINQCKADITKPYIENETYKTEIYPVDILRKLIFPLNSEAYKLKKEIVQEFYNQGVDYYSIPVSDDTKSKIKLLYPDNYEEYIKIY